MKWKSGFVPEEPKVGDVRQRNIFSWRSRRCVDGYTRWLTEVLITERYDVYSFKDPDNYTVTYTGTRWIEQETLAAAPRLGH